MKELVVDTSVWIEAFHKKPPTGLEEALKEGRVVLPPLVLAELLSGAHSSGEQEQLTRFLSYIPLHPVGRSHWRKTGLLRAYLKTQGLTVSIPDCHIAQCALECDGVLLTLDHIFQKIALHSALQLMETTR